MKSGRRRVAAEAGEGIDARREPWRQVKKGISEIVGTADSLGKSGVTVYRALRLVLCARCGAEIKEGALFTRRTLAGSGLRILPQCHGCVPFTLRSGTRDRSALIESLLAPATEEALVTVRKHERSEKTAEAIEQRLGPALRRARQRR